MSFYRPHIEGLISSVLADLAPGMDSQAAVNLLLGTLAVESSFGRFLRQVGGGPALGVFQMEPATFHWLRDKYGRQFGFSDARDEDLVWNLRLAITAARLRFWAVPEALPRSDDVDGLARYWKYHYNTHAGAGTVEQFVRAWSRWLD